MPRLEQTADPAPTAGLQPGRRAPALLLIGIATVLLVAWAYLLWMDWGMRHMDRAADMLLMPRMVGWGAVDLALVFLMWALMMAAMMLPTAMPMVSVFAGLNRTRGEAGRTAAFVAGYLALWTAFGAAATAASLALAAKVP